MLSVVLFSTLSFAHSGGTDANGCHAGSKPYHCHGAPAPRVSAPRASPSRTASGQGSPRAICIDGTISYSATLSGTCSSHGGVASWLDGLNHADRSSSHSSTASSDLARSAPISSSPSCGFGYQVYGNSCLEIILPDNAHLELSGHSWSCDRGFLKIGHFCWVLPDHAHINADGETWSCDVGYFYVRNDCERL
jgi:hypothetical protein